MKKIILPVLLLVVAAGFGFYVSFVRALYFSPGQIIFDSITPDPATDQIVVSGTASGGITTQGQECPSPTNGGPANDEIAGQLSDPRYKIDGNGNWPLVFTVAHQGRNRPCGESRPSEEYTYSFSFTDSTHISSLSNGFHTLTICALGGTDENGGVLCGSSNFTAERGAHPKISLAPTSFTFNAQSVAANESGRDVSISERKTIRESDSTSYRKNEGDFLSWLEESAANLFSPVARVEAAACILNVAPPQNLGFDATQNGQLPSAKTIHIGVPGPPDCSANDSDGRAEIQYLDGAGWLNLEQDYTFPIGPASSFDITVQPNTTALPLIPPGEPTSYEAKVIVKSTNYYAEKLVQYIIEPSSKPAIKIQPMSFTFNAIQKSAGNTQAYPPFVSNIKIKEPDALIGAWHNFLKSLSAYAYASMQGSPPQILTITNIGSEGTTLNWHADVSTESGGNWLSISPTDGHLSSQASAPASVSVDVTDMNPGIYKGAITVSDPNASNSPQTATVILNITEPPPPKNHTLTVIITGNGAGRVTSNPSGINCGSDCSQSYSEGQQVQLTETADSGSTFDRWSGGGCSGTGQTCTVSMTQDITVTATFNSAQEGAKACFSLIPLDINLNYYRPNPQSPPQVGTIRDVYVGISVGSGGSVSITGCSSDQPSWLSVKGCPIGTYTSNQTEQFDVEVVGRPPANPTNIANVNLLVTTGQNTSMTGSCRPDTVVVHYDIEGPSTSCSVSAQNVNLNDEVTFTASGGNGTFAWSVPSPNSNSCSGGGAVCKTSFSNVGLKIVKVNNVSCPTVNVTNMPSLVCSPRNPLVKKYPQAPLSEEIKFSADIGSNPCHACSWTTSHASPQNGSGDTFTTRFDSEGLIAVNTVSGPQSDVCTADVRQPSLNIVPPGSTVKCGENMQVSFAACLNSKGLLSYPSGQGSCPDPVDTDVSDSAFWRVEAADSNLASSDGNGQFSGKPGVSGTATVHAAYDNIVADATLQVTCGSDFSIDASQPPQPAARGSHAIYHITASNVDPANPYGPLIDLSVSGLPPGVTAGATPFSPSSIHTGDSSDLTLNVTASANAQAEGPFNFLISGAGRDGKPPHSIVRNISLACNGAGCGGGGSHCDYSAHSCSNSGTGPSCNYDSQCSGGGGGGGLVCRSNSCTYDPNASGNDSICQNKNKGDNCGTSGGSHLECDSSGSGACINVPNTPGNDQDRCGSPSLPACIAGTHNECVNSSCQSVPNRVGHTADTCGNPGQPLCGGTSSVSCDSFIPDRSRLVIPPPASSKLSWSSTNATKCAISASPAAIIEACGGLSGGCDDLPPNGNTITTPKNTTTYGLTCSNPSIGSKSCPDIKVHVFNIKLQEILPR